MRLMESMIYIDHLGLVWALAVRVCADCGRGCSARTLPTERRRESDSSAHVASRSIQLLVPVASSAWSIAVSAPLLTLSA